MASTIWQNLTDAVGKNMSIEEMGKKYLNTYLILINKNKEPMVVLYSGYQDDYHIFTDEHGVKLRISHDTDLEIICKFPERCLFNHEKRALEFIRLPYRQYKRGICKENVQIYSPVRKLIENRSTSCDIKTIKSALFPIYPNNCEEAIEKLNNKHAVSIALNEKFMLSQNVTSLSKNKQLFFLWFSNKIIGTFTNNVFHIKHSLFKQEVLDNIHLFKPYKIEF